jgi:hypothetical protein
MVIVNDDTSIINELGASLTDNARVIIYDCSMFIVQATGCYPVVDLSSTQHLFQGGFTEAIVQSMLLPNSVATESAISNGR